MSTQILERELDRLEDLRSNGLDDAFRAYLGEARAFSEDVKPKLALAAALIEAGLRLQNLGGRAAAPTTLLMGDLCLARGSRLLADSAPLATQVAVARAIETMSAVAAADKPAPDPRALLSEALAARP